MRQTKWGSLKMNSRTNMRAKMRFLRLELMVDQMQRGRQKRRLVFNLTLYVASRCALAKIDLDVMDVDQQTFIVGRNKLEPGQTLSPDLSTYEMLHALSTPWPCLSFDIIRDGLGDNRKTYPATMYAVAGTQADAKREKDNQIMVMKFSGLSRMDREHDEEDSSDDEDEDA